MPIFSIFPCLYSRYAFLLFQSLVPSISPLHLSLYLSSLPIISGLRLFLSTSSFRYPGCPPPNSTVHSRTGRVLMAEQWLSGCRDPRKASAPSGVAMTGASQGFASFQKWLGVSASFPGERVCGSWQMLFFASCAYPGKGTSRIAHKQRKTVRWP